MTIRFFPSLLPGEPIESYEYAGTIAGFFLSVGIDYTVREQQPVTLTLNGVTVPVDEWPDTVVTHSDDVEVRLIPRGGVFEGLGNILGKIFNALFGWLMPSAGGDRNDPGQGRKLETATAKANQAKLGEVVPELAGRFRRYPDYLTPPRRHFVDLREQWLEFHACVGPGRYEILPENVKVGDTPFSSLGDDGHYEIFDPGMDLSSTSTHEHWYTVSEVGGTSSGTAGLVLSTEIANRINEQPSSYTFDGVSISRSEGLYPPAWGGGTQVFIQYERPYTITRVFVPPSSPEEQGYYISDINGYFGHVAPILNQSIWLGEIESEVEYRVDSIVPGVDGMATIRLWDDGEMGGPVDLPPGPEVPLVFGANIRWTISTYSEEEMSVSGPGSFESVTLSGALVVFAGGTVYGEWTSEFFATPGNEVTDTAEADFFFPAGLAFIDGEGNIQSRSVGIELQYRDVTTSGPRVTLARSYTQATLDQIGMTERVTFTAIRPAFRARRVGAEGTSTQVQDTIHWYGLKSRLPTRTSYPRWTTMSIKLRSGGRIAAQSENQINVVATRILPTLQSDGSWGSEQVTRDISAFARYIAQTIGYTDSDLDIDEFRRLHSVWASRGETLDYVFDLTTVKEAMNVAFKAGMAELTVADGQIRPVRDDVRTQFEHSYSPQNMTGPLRRTFKTPKHDDPDGVEVEYIDGETWTKQTVRCFLPGDQGFKLEKVTINGVTDRVRAWRIGMRRRRQLRYRVWDYAFGTEMDALNSEYLSYVPLFDDIPGYGQSAILERIEPISGAALLHVSEPLRWESGVPHLVAYRRPDGTISPLYSASPGVDDCSLIANIPQPWPSISLKQEPPHVYFGPAERM
ncbi:MAG: host specificity factor TipJ family phage tail protein, partial [Candidimonas sp.]